MECFEFSELWPGVGIAAHGTLTVKTKLAALREAGTRWDVGAQPIVTYFGLP
jgi:hypothetical protein